MTDKQQAYEALVRKRKNFHFTGLLNPSEIEGGRYDCDHVEPWANWQGNLNASIMLVGKDFGGLGFFKKFKGKCDSNSVTNKKLAELFSCLNINIGTPDKPERNAPVFLTNAITGIIDTDKKGGNKISSSLKYENVNEFLRPLIDIVDPKIIITMGKVAYDCVSRVFGNPTKPLSQALIDGGIFHALL